MFLRGLALPRGAEEIGDVTASSARPLPLRDGCGSGNVAVAEVDAEEFSEGRENDRPSFVTVDSGGAGIDMKASSGGCGGDGIGDGEVDGPATGSLGGPSMASSGTTADSFPDEMGPWRTGEVGLDASDWGPENIA